MDPKLKKMVVKAALSIAAAALIGYMMKLEKRLEEHIDEHYAEQDSTEN